MLRFVLLGLVAAAADSSFPYVPASTVALLRFSSLDATYAQAVQLLGALPHGLAPSLTAALGLPPNFRALDLDQPFTAAFLLHASGNLSAPFVPGLWAVPVPALLLLLPGVSAEQLLQLPGLEPANDGDPSHYLIPRGLPGVRATLGAFGDDTGALVLGLGHYDLSVAPSTSLRLPASAMATINASAASLVLELSQLDLLVKPALLGGPLLRSLVGTFAGLALEFPVLNANTPEILLAYLSIDSISKIIELALSSVGDTHAVVLSARLDGRSDFLVRILACAKNDSCTTKLNFSTAALWPGDTPALDAPASARAEDFFPYAPASTDTLSYLPASTVALLRLSELNSSYSQLMSAFDYYATARSPFPPFLLSAGLPECLQTLDLDQPIVAAVLLHAPGNLSAPFVPGFLAAPRPALLLLLPGVPIENLTQLPGLQPAYSGSRSHYFIPSLPEGRVTVGAYGNDGSTGIVCLGLQFYDLTEPPRTSLRLPSGAAATMSASAVTLTFDFSQLDYLFKPLLAAWPSLYTLFETLAGAVFQYAPAAQERWRRELAHWGLEPGIFGALTTFLNKVFELTLTLAGDIRTVVLSARLEDRCELHVGLHAYCKNGSCVTNPSASPDTTANLWPDMPALDTHTILVAGDAVSPAAAAQFDRLVFGPALAQLETAKQGRGLFSTASLLKDALTLLRDLSGSTDGWQFALLDNGGSAAAGHPNCPPDLPTDPTTLFPPGTVALFSKGNTVADVWQRHDTLLSAITTYTALQNCTQMRELLLCGEFYDCSSCVSYSVSSSETLIGGVLFESRRIIIFIDGFSFVSDTSVGMIGDRVMVFGLLSDDAVLPFVHAALRLALTSSFGKFSDEPTVNATFSRLPKSRSSVVALRPSAFARYWESFYPWKAKSEDILLPIVLKLLDEAGFIIGSTLTFNESNAVPAGIEFHADLAVRVVWLASLLHLCASPLTTPHPPLPLNPLSAAPFQGWLLFGRICPGEKVQFGWMHVHSRLLAA